MARKSRYNKPSKPPTSSHNIYKTGIYARLSVSDGDDVSESIANQINMATNYIHSSGDLLHVKTYIDDGYSGRNFNRPGFEEMMIDIQKGVINCVVVKDTSRLGRNYILVGELLDLKFPCQRVRFISINDQYDNVNDLGATLSPAMVFKNFMYDRESLATSKTISSTINALEQCGSFLPSSGSIPYGYLRDKANNTYVIDGEAAPVVETICKLRLDGLNFTAIAKQLNDRNIPSPGKLRFLRDQSSKETFRDALWVRKTVREILSDQVYIGNRVHGKMKKDRINGKKHYTDEKDWIIIKNAHPPIVSEDVFHSVQQMAENEVVSRSEQVKRADAAIDHRELFRGLIFCADCGKPMLASKSCSREGSTTASRIFYDCSNYRNSGRIRCSCHYILDQDVYSAVIRELDTLCDKFLAPGGIQSDETVCVTKLKEVESELGKISDVKNQCNCAIMELYERYILGELTKEAFSDLAQHHRSIRADAQARENLLLEQKYALEKQSNSLQICIDALQQYHDTKTLSHDTMGALVKRITIDVTRKIHIQFHMDNIKDTQ